ncbi:LOW QUALITY PROTEIN: hypothetical protein Cgig2_005397 [Carnegiea gigantea]|uniref:Uncharacterized protein n=1 Tax=Carnegiea gigantea TaxID=171969 RepID=A0A9Q1JU16_9CARY|nr:LOW QUALITY PROTEIN: hypothetical protein Cgig2_005397 [Carnegiea gigantea]
MPWRSSILRAIEEEEAQEDPKSNQLESTITVSSRKHVVLAVGIYVIQRNRRSLVLSSDFFLWVIVSCTLTKLILKRFSHPGLKRTMKPPRHYYINGICDSTGLLILLYTIDNGAFDWIIFCIRLLYNTCDDSRKMWLHSCKESFVITLAVAL